MDLKDLENAEALADIDLARLSGSKLQLVLFVGLLAIFGMHVSAQPRSDGTTDFAKYAMKLPETSLLRIEPKVIRLPANNRLQVSRLNDGTGSDVVGETNSIGTGSGEGNSLVQELLCARWTIRLQGPLGRDPARQ